MIRINDLEIRYDSKIILDRQNIQIPSCKLIGIVGESGCGKTSLLNILALLKPSDIEINNQSLTNLNNEERDLYRLQHISYLRQNLEFVHGLSCKDIIKLSASLVGKKVDVDEILDLVHLKGLGNQQPSSLSGGQQQLLAIAEAIARDTDLLLCDEITNSLDTDMKSLVFDILKELSKDRTVIVVSHEKDYPDRFDFIYRFEEHKLIRDNDIEDNREIANKPILTFQGQRYLNKAYYKSQLKFKILFYILVVFGIVVSSIGYKYSTQFTKHLEYIKESAKNQGVSINYTNGSDLFNFTSNAKPFEQDTIDQIAKIDGVKSIQPVYDLVISPIFNDQDGNEIIDLEKANVFIDGEECNITNAKEEIEYVQRDRFDSNEEYEAYIKEYGDQMKNYSYSSVDIYSCDFNLFDSYCSSSIYQDGDIYLTGQLASSCGITEKNRTVEMNVLIPVSYQTNEQDEISYDENMNIISISPGLTVKYKQVPMKFTVRGILDLYFPNLYHTGCFYIDENQMNTLIQQYSQPDFMANTYNLKIDGDANQIYNAIKEIDSNITIQQLEQYYSSVLASKTQVESQLHIFFYIAIVMIVVLCCFYSYFTYKQDQHFYAVYSNQGLNKKYLNRSIVFGIGIDTVIIIVFTSIFTNVIYSILLKNQTLYELSNAMQAKHQVYLLSIILSIIFIVLENSISLIKVVFKNDSSSI